jgi:hypothetical protein
MFAARQQTLCDLHQIFAGKGPHQASHRYCPPSLLRGASGVNKRT